MANAKRLSLVALLVVVFIIPAFYQSAAATKVAYSSFPNNGSFITPWVIYQQGTGAYYTNINSYGTHADIGIDTPVYVNPTVHDEYATAVQYTYGSETGGSISDSQSDNSVYHVSTSSAYVLGGSGPIDFRYVENLATNTTTSTTYQADCVLSFTPAIASTYNVFGYAELKGSSTSYNTNARMVINSTTVFQETLYRVRSASCWYDVAFMKQIYVGKTTATTFKIQFSTSNAGNTASIQFARILAMNSTALYQQAETRITTTQTSWQNATSLSLSPVSGARYLLFATANVDGSSTSYDTNYRFITNNGTVLASGQKRTGVAAARYSVGLMRLLTFSTASDKIVLQYDTSNAGNTAGIGYMHIALIRQDVFKNSYYKDAQGTEYTPAAAATWYDTGASITYTPQAGQHIIFGCMEEKAGSTSGYVQWRQNNNAALNNTDQLYEPAATDYECEWTFVRLSLTATSRTDKLQYLGSTTSARVRNPRIESFQMDYNPTITRYRIDYYYESQFTEGARADVTQLGWLVNGLTSSPSVHIYIYNWGTSGWDNTTLVLTSVEGDATQASITINSYMAANGKMRIRFAQANQPSSFTVSVDYERWRINYNAYNTPVIHNDALRFYNQAASGYRVRLEFNSTDNLSKIRLFNVSITATDTDGTITLQVNIIEGTIVQSTGAYVAISVGATLYIRTWSLVQDTPPITIYLTAMIAPTGNESPKILASLKMVLNDYTP